MSYDFIPVADPKAQLDPIEREVMDAIRRVLSSGRYILGREVASFEAEFAEFLGLRFCACVASGTDALSLALRAVGITAGDEVITVSHSAVATVAAIEQIGAVPVFADIDPSNWCMDPKTLGELISEKTKALLPVHIYGQPAPMESILSVSRQYGLKVVEDCAQAHGAEIGGKRVGTFGDAAAFSFYPTKNLGALGDGGAVATDSEEIYDRLRLLREYGWKDRYISASPGVNSRLDEIQAAVLRVKLPLLCAHNARRRDIARRYSDCADGRRIVCPADIDGTLHAMHLYVVECNDRSSLRQWLERLGIGTALHYPMPIHRQPAFAGRIRGAEALPITERLYEGILTLPMYPELTDRQVERICGALSQWSALK